MTAVDQESLESLAASVGEALTRRGERLATAESCTGGWVGQVLTAIAGSSAWYERGFVTYANDAKIEMLGLTEAILIEHGAVSETSARAMATGALARSPCEWALAVTGIAGPSGGSPDKPVGTVCFAWTHRDKFARSETQCFAGDRRAVRAQSVAAALSGLLKLLAQQPPMRA